MKKIKTDCVLDFCLRAVFSPAIFLQLVPCKKYMTTAFAHLRKFEKEILGME
ncbi:MAG: hypothetical protein K2U26_15305 [Cyclobacteriaceae bacterium]|nr:hypothetical protein [Cyclobacteriaceae bacterium]